MEQAFAWFIILLFILGGRKVCRWLDKQEKKDEMCFKANGNRRR